MLGHDHRHVLLVQIIKVVFSPCELDLNATVKEIRHVKN